MIGERPVQPRLAILIGTEATQRIEPLARFDLDHVGAQIGEIAGAMGTSHQPAHIDDAKTGKREVHQMKIGRASGRERVCQDVEHTRVDVSAKNKSKNRNNYYE